MRRDEIPPGTLYLLILKTLARSGEMHGYEIANSIQQVSQDVLQVEEGSRYPALQRMLIKGWVTAEWAQRRKPARAVLPADDSGAETTGSGIEAVRTSDRRNYAGNRSGVRGVPA